MQTTVRTKELEPYVGPRPFKTEEREIFFGREREADELVSLITAHPVVLFYAQSGAGKTSLLNAALIPKLRDEEEFDVLTPLRVQGQITPGLKIDAKTNIYMLNALLGSGENQDPAKLAGMTFAEFLKARPPKQNKYGEPTLRVVIFDQFEELFTAYPEHWKERQAFFEQVRDAIDGNPKKGIEGDPQLRVLFSMREDYIAEMDPYAPILPENLRTRYRLELMRERSALAAVKEPLKKMGASFAPGVAEQLVKDLLKIPSRKAGDAPKMGQYIEPVQLQIVCQSLWQALGDGARVITQEHLKDYGDLNQVLLNFYERSIHEVDKATKEDEADLRTWLEDTFITAEGTRAPVTRGSEMTAGKPNLIIELLAGQRLLKEEWRGTDTRWYELSHDRFIEPIRRSNEKWMAQQSRAEQTHLLLEAKARAWRQGGGELLAGDELAGAERLISSPIKTSKELKALVHASRATAQQTRLKKLSIGLTVLAILFIFMAGLTFFAYKQMVRADRETEAAKQARAEAESRKTEAERQYANALDFYRKEQDLKKALEAEKRAVEEQRDKADGLRKIAEAKKHEAEDAKSKIETALGYVQHARDEAEKQQGVAEEQRRLAEESAKQLKVQSDLAVSNANEAKANANQANSRLLAVTASDYLESDPELSVLIAREAIEKYAPTRTAEEVVREGLHSLSSVGQVLRGPEGGTNGPVSKISSVEFSPDGEHIITTSNNDGTVRLWKNGTKVRLIRELDRKLPPTRSLRMVNVNSASFSPDGNLIVTADTDGAARVFDGHTGELIKKFTGHTDAVTRALFSPDGQYIATSSEDSNVIVWNARTGEVFRQLADHKAGVVDLAWSPNSTYIATEAKDESGRLWNIKTGEFYTLDGLKGDVPVINFSPDSKKLVTERGPGRVTVWDVEQHKELINIGGNEASNPDQQTNRTSITSAAFSPDNRFLIVADSDGDARAWSILKKPGTAEWGARLVSDLKGHTGSILRVLIIPNSETAVDKKLVAVTVSSDNTARVWNAATGQTMFVLKGHSGGVNYVAVNPRNPGQLITGSDDYTARLWNIGGEQLLPELHGHIGGISSAVFGPNASIRNLVTAGFDGSTRLWDARAGTVKVLRGPITSETKADNSGNAAQQYGGLRGHSERVTSAAFSPDGNYVVTASLDNTAIVWALKERAYSPVILRHENAVYKAAFSPDGENVVTACADGLARVWDRETGEVKGVLQGHKGIVTSAEYSPDGRSIVTSGSDATVRIWDAGDFKLRLVLKGHDGAVYSASYSPDGRSIVTASGDNTAKVWDAATGRELALLEGHAGEVNSAVWSPNGKFIATSSDDKTARIWEPDREKPGAWRTVTVLHGHKGKVYSVGFSPDSKYVVTASEDGTVRIAPPEMFAYSSKELLSLIDERVNKRFSPEEWEKLLSTLQDK